MELQPQELEALFSRNLRIFREEAGLTQVALAQAAGIPQPHVSALERGVIAPSLATIARLAEALDIRPALLISSAGVPVAPQA